MNTCGFPVYYYPTKAVIIDDKKSFLESLEFISIDGIEIDSVLGPLEFMQAGFDYLRADVNFDIKVTESGEINTTWSGRSIYKELKAKQVSVVVCDYEMPEMCGIDLLKSINSTLVKKILITGSENEEVVIKAFNDKVIDAFIKKSDPYFHEKLMEMIKRSVYSSFAEITYQEMIFLHKLYPDAVLFKKGFEEFLGLQLKMHGSNEFYIIGANGEILFYDKYGNEKKLMMTHDGIIDTYKTVAIENGAPDNILENFNDKSRVPFFSKEDETKLEFEEWNTIFHAYDTVSLGSQKYYYKIL